MPKASGICLGIVRVIFSAEVSDEKCLQIVYEEECVLLATRSSSSTMISDLLIGAG